MFTKALEEITKKVIDWLATAKHGWAMLTGIVILIGGFFLVREIRTAPEFTATLRDPRFVTLVWMTVTLAICYLAWQLFKRNRTAQVLVVGITVGCSAAAWWRMVDIQPRPLRIDVLFDADAVLPANDAADFFGSLKQSQIVVTFVSPNAPKFEVVDRVEFDTVRDRFSAYLRPEPQTIHTVYVTSKYLSGAGWDNAFYVTSPRFSVVSTYGILPEGEQEKRTLLRKYLASMVPLVAMHGQAMEKEVQLLRDRDPSTEHGCLHDFSVKKQLMMEKLRRGPKMCAEEDAEITATFGSEIASEYRAILSSAAAVSIER